MKDFNSIIENQKRGIRLSIENSTNLYSSAQLLSVNKFYSPAVPILILSAEEMIKSFALCLEILLGEESEVKKIIKDSKVKASNSYLFNHEDKHKLAKAIISDLKKIALTVKIIKIFLRGKLKEALEFISISPSEQSKVDQLLNNIDNFNRLKNEGFYVDKRGDEWKTPLNVTESEYRAILNDVELIRTVFSQKVHYFLNFPDADLVLLYEAMHSNI
jgi:AbiV family abortive infection protein